MPAKTPDDLFALLDSLGVAHQSFQHQPIFTVAEGLDLRTQMPGGHSKNLFLKDKKGALFLVSALDESQIDLNALSKALGAARFSFGSAELMVEKLGVTPGAVTAFAIINDPNQEVRFVLDEALLSRNPVHFHPLRNDATTAVSPAGLMAFLKGLGREPVRVSFAGDGPPRLIDPSAPLPI